ncbi:pyruvate dehydrogenase (acetyl-transferring) E1 component subunit alpha [Rhodoluna sp. KAS3]|jgi:2-oxoisovalerate dehydrogenase E1 component alpha subunit|uniref:pyruvate dehydrogenase (acetyl-transferring) E1 component subunit alpha n=1 Tax=Rhodoluna sp. KAS3 TaxID=942880 RepID=UPI002231933B|nr:pyruvate dehydrogenase (acetyl-transferring) E1 component subunit alpha [Rhodoluna sp. KAS3]BDS49712.1 pyruvate dehydrogenase E1 component subunit alpha [Rhodoluna sp. KAS3]
MTYQDASNVPMVQLLSPDGQYGVPAQYAEYGKYIDQLGEADFLKFYRDMARMRRFDNEATALQRQGQLGLWIPAIGQEAAQIGSGYGVGHNDHIFPSYREHGVAITHGIDLMAILKMLRGVNHGGWNPDETRFHLYAIVLGTQVLHATGYAMGVKFDGKVGTGNRDEDLAVISYFGDGATAEGDVSESFLFAATTQAPMVFFCQNNQWAISSPVDSQTTVPLYQRGMGFGVPGVRIDGNDVLASYAVTKKHMDDARNGAGPFMIEALTYRIGAHTTSDDPTKYRSSDEVEYWKARDPLARFEKFLRRQGIGDDFFNECEAAGEALSAEIREKTFALGEPPIENMFKHVYSESHPLIEEQLAWLEAYEASFGQGGAN